MAIKHPNYGNQMDWVCCVVLHVVYNVSSFMHSCKSFEIHYYKHPLANHFGGISKLYKFSLNAHAHIYAHEAVVQTAKRFCCANAAIHGICVNGNLKVHQGRKWNNKNMCRKKTVPRKISLHTMSHFSSQLNDVFFFSVDWTSKFGKIDYFNWHEPACVQDTHARTQTQSLLIWVHVVLWMVNGEWKQNCSVTRHTPSREFT